MNNILSAIAETEEKIKGLRIERESADPKEYARIDKDILKLQLRARSLKESEEIQKRNAGPEVESIDNSPEEEPEYGCIDNFTIAKIHVNDIVDQVSLDGGNFNTDARLIAAFRLSNVIEQLELLRMYGDFMVKEDFPDNNTFIGPFVHYVDEYNNRIENAKKEVEKISMEVEQLEAALADAQNAGNVEEIINYSDALEIARKTKEHLLPVVHFQEEQNVLPEGSIKEAWADICDLYRNEYEMRLEIIKAARQIYESACDELILFDDRLKYLRDTLQAFAKAHSNNPDQIISYNNLITANMDLLWLKNPEKSGEKAYSKLCFDKTRML